MTARLQGRGPSRGVRLAPLVLLVAAAALLAGGLVVAERTTIDLATDPDVVRIDGADIDDGFGGEVARCDINGDGLTDVVIAADRANGPNNARYYAGEAYVIYGRRGAWLGPLAIAEDRDIRIIGQKAYDYCAAGVTCGDVNGDGFDDILVGGFNSDGPGGTRNQAGQAHLILGGPALPELIDLADSPGTIIYGGYANDKLARVPAVGDVNGDGYGDLLLDAGQQHSMDGTRLAVGRVYILFGRPEWPAVVDLLTDSDVRIDGKDDLDGLGRTLMSDDLDRDGLDEVIAGSWGGSGPGNSRPAAGEIHLFYGRQSWPPVIDLYYESSDVVFLGADFDDQLTYSRGLALADLDGNGYNEIVTGSALADGPSNTAPSTGEARTWEYLLAPPPLVDLAVETTSVAYGVEAGDRYCTVLTTGDVVGDGTDDLVCTGPYRDGPEGTREDAGEVMAFWGRQPFPAVIEFATDGDLLIYGAAAGNRLGLRRLADLNGDGAREIVVTVSSALDDKIESVWLVSPFDFDGDGITQLPDNCPLVANPDQLDSDGDLVGDACQGDYDGDGQADELDCAPGDPLGGTPPPVADLVFEPNSNETLSWQPAPFADRYDITRGLVSHLDGSDYGACQNHRDPDLTDTSFDDDEQPAAGTGFFYLVRGQNLTCPATGSYGVTSTGTERDNGNPNDCP